jgi:transcriptional regulator with GAF, ATPase, and Fis domain
MNATPHASLSLIGSSPAMRALDLEIETAARSHAKVLITGETGVGKEVVARMIHHRGSRSHAPMAAINCAGIPDTLLESELFGHVRGSFTDAYRDKPGLFEGAHNGTAFLDEAGEMSLRMQALLLRFLETGELQRVGSDRVVKRVDVRIIAATNRDLSQRIETGEFRADLYYRLNVILLQVPSLRQRPGDIRELLEHFLESYSNVHRVARRRLTPEALGLLMAYRWPGNVRELKNVVERLAVRAPGEDIHPRDLPEECRDVTGGGSRLPASADSVQAPDIAGDLVQRMTEKGESFWTAVHAPFIDRDLVRDHLRAVVRAGLERTSGNYRMVLELFNLPPSDYKRFLSFLRKHNCHYPVQAFRVPMRSARHIAGGTGKMWVDGHPLETARQQPRLGRGPDPARPNIFYPPGPPAGAGISVDRLRGQPRAS